MLLMGQQLINKPVLSLQTGSAIGTVLDVIINPNNLKIEGWYAKDPTGKQKLVLLSQDIRDIIQQGFVVNDHSALTEPNELIRLESIIKLGFVLIGKPVVTKNKKNLGKVNDYAFEKESLFIQKLYTDKSILKSFSGQAAIVNRNQIVEINRRQIIATEATIPGRVKTILNPVPQEEASPA